MKVFGNWIDAEHKPTEPGWYQRKYGTNPQSRKAILHWCYWNGTSWSWPDDETHCSESQHLPWRGSYEVDDDDTEAEVDDDDTEAEVE